MQAGESLSFITVPHELITPEPRPVEEREYVLYTFYRSVKNMLTRPSDSARSLERPEEAGVFIARESSYQVPFNDGSYLHLVAYGHEYDGDYVDLGLSITEHNDSGEYLGGFSYEMDQGADLRYAAHHSPTNLSYERYDEDRTYHFSLIDQYEHRDELEYLAATGNEEVRSAVQEMLNKWHEEADLSLVSKDVGLSWREPSAEEMQLIGELAKIAQPFKVPQR